MIKHAELGAFIKQRRKSEKSLIKAFLLSFFVPFGLCYVHRTFGVVSVLVLEVPFFVLLYYDIDHWMQQWITNADLSIFTKTQTEIYQMVLQDLYAADGAYFSVLTIGIMSAWMFVHAIVPLWAIVRNQASRRKSLMTA